MVFRGSFQVEPCSAKPRQSSGQVRAKVVKHLGFAILVAGSIVAGPAAAQNLSTASYDFIQAVKKSDGDKALGVLARSAPGIVNTKDDQGNTGLIIAISRSDEQWTG